MIKLRNKEKFNDDDLFGNNDIFVMLMMLLVLS